MLHLASFVSVCVLVCLCVCVCASESVASDYLQVFVSPIIALPCLAFPSHAIHPKKNIPAIRVRRLTTTLSVPFRAVK